MGDTEDFLDCYEVNDNGVTHKSTQLNEGNNWVFGLLPKTERDGGDGMGGGNGGVVLSFAINIFITTLLVIVIMYTLRWFNTKTPVESGPGHGGGGTNISRIPKGGMRKR